MTLLLVVVLIFALNILLGYWRTNASRFFIQWFLVIRIPVLLTIGLMLWLIEGLSWIMLPILVTVFFDGQFTGNCLSNLGKVGTGVFELVPVNVLGEEIYAGRSMKLGKGRYVQLEN